MSKSNDRKSGQKQPSCWKTTSIALMASTVILGGYALQTGAVPAPLQISQRQQEWDATLRTARLLDDRQQETALVLQLDVLDKPETSYANAVYQIFARQDGRWREIYTSRGARLITGSRGRVTLPAEIVSLSDLERRLGTGVNLASVELKTIAQLRYDTLDGQRDQQVYWQQTQTYSAIAQTTTNQIATASTATQTSETHPIVVQTPERTATAQTSAQQVTTTQGMSSHRGHFSLGILQSQAILPEVIARVSLMPRRPDGFLAERFVGDFRYRMNQRAQFIRGLNPGDRVVVRLFTPQNQLIGYSEFELLSDNAAVNLILPAQTASYGTVRTVYGIDADRNGTLDQGDRTYDYFTQIRGSNLSTMRVAFLSSSQSINPLLFRSQGLPNPLTTGVYTSSFQTGTFALVNRTIAVFGSNLAAALTALPGQLVQITNLSTNSISTYEVSQRIVTYQEVGISQGTIVQVNDDGEYEEVNDREHEVDDRESDRPRRHCNQGIGNGSEGCDPGNSHPHGGSNDEGGRTSNR